MLETTKAQLIAEACKDLTAQEFLNKFDHLLELALRMAQRSSQRDIENPDCPTRIRVVAREDKETWQVFADTIDRLTSKGGV